MFESASLERRVCCELGFRETTTLIIYGTVGIGVATALLTLACGPIVERFGAHGFWAMAAVCAAALPLARTLREPTADPG